MKTTGLLHKLVCRIGDWEGVRPWPRPLSGRGPKGADDSTPDEQVGTKKKKKTLMANVLLLARD